MNCTHPDGLYLYAATDAEGNDLAVFRCAECGAKYVEGA